jgi:hypothetical protein
MPAGIYLKITDEAGNKVALMGPMDEEDAQRITARERDRGRHVSRHHSKEEVYKREASDRLLGETRRTVHETKRAREKRVKQDRGVFDRDS